MGFVFWVGSFKLWILDSCQKHAGMTVKSRNDREKLRLAFYFVSSTNAPLVVVILGFCEIVGSEIAASPAAPRNDSIGVLCLSG